MFVSFTQHGSQTRARGFQLALVYWYMGLEDPKTPSNLKTLELYKGKSVQFQEGDQFIDQMIGATERHFNKKPVVDPNLSHALQCQMILKWLELQGKISDLVFADSFEKLQNPKLPPN